MSHRQLFDVVLLAGGAGGSMRPLTEFIPKPMLPLGNKSIIQRILEQIAAAEVFGTTYVVVSGQFAELLKEHVELLRDARRIGRQSVEYIEMPGSAWPLRVLRNRLVRPFLVHCGDVLAPALPYEDLVAAHLELRMHRTAEFAGTLLVTDRCRTGVGLVSVDSGGAVDGFREKPPMGDSKRLWVNSGIAIFEPSILDCVRTPRDQIFGDIVPRARSKRYNYEFSAYKYQGPWYHFQHLADYHAEHVDRNRRKKWLRRSGSDG